MDWKRAVRDGALVGLAGGVAFFLLHAVIVEPIWGALPRGLLAVANGALLGLAFARVRAREPSFEQPLGGMLYGALAALALGPFLAAGWLRTRGAPTFLWGLILGLLLVSFWFVTQAAQTRPERDWRRVELPAALLAANAFPAWLLVYIADLHEEVPDPFPLVGAIVAIYLASGAGLTALTMRSDARFAEPSPIAAGALEPPVAPEPVPAPMPEPTPAPMPEPTPAPMPEPTPAPMPEPEPMPAPMPETMPEPMPAPVVKRMATFELVTREAPAKKEEAPKKKRTTTFEVVKRDEKKKD